MSTRRAVTLAIVAWLAGLPLVVLAMTLRSDVSEIVRGTFELLPFVACYVLSAWAAWHLAIAGRDRSRIYSRAMRAVIIAGVAAVGLIFINPRWSAYYARWLPTSRFDRVRELLQLIGRLAALGWPVSTAWATARLTALAGTAGRSGVALALVITSVLGTLVAGLLSVGVTFNDMEHATSTDLIAYLVGPTGTAPAIWFGVASILTQPRFYNYQTVVIESLILAIAIAISIALLRLRGAITRAIALGKLPAASSRSSLSPRPPA